RHGSEEWKVKHDPRKQEPEGLRERAAYVLENTIDIILKKEANFRARKWIPSNYTYEVALKRTGVPLYEKASKSNGIIEYSPADILKVKLDFATPGLSSDEIYWHASYHGSTGWMTGYILQEDLDFK